MTIAVINDYVPLQRRPFIGSTWFRFCDISVGRRNMGHYKVYAQFILFSYGFQVRSR